MPEAEWGTKRICPTTSKRFYDLNKDPIVSPYTGCLLYTSDAADDTPCVDPGVQKDCHFEFHE